MDNVIATNRLDLISLSVEVHRAMIDGDYALADTLMGVEGLKGITLPRQVLELRLGQLTKNPAMAQWLLRAVVLRDSNEVVGNMGFHERPDAAYLLDQDLEGLEFGYTIIEAHRRKGYAKEASIGLMNWASGDHGVDKFVLSIGPQNEASKGLALSIGFSKHKEYEHPDRGREFIYVKGFDSP